MTCICSLFWAFKPTEMTDFPTIFQKGKPYPLIYLKPEKGPLFGRSLACIGHYTCREYAPRKILMFVNQIMTLQADATSSECVLACESHE